MVTVPRSLQGHRSSGLLGLGPCTGHLDHWDGGRHAPRGKHILHQFPCHCEGSRRAVEKGSHPSGKQACNNESVLITHAKWQLNGFQLKCTVADEGVQNLETGFARDRGRSKWLSWLSHCPFVPLTAAVYPPSFLPREPRAVRQRTHLAICLWFKKRRCSRGVTPQTPDRRSPLGFHPRPPPSVG